MTDRILSPSTSGAPSSRRTLFDHDNPDALAPLARFKGQKPPAPDWFEAVLAQKPETHIVQSNGTGIEMLTWGERGKPGLLLVHGNSAHAHWWAWIAPLLAEHFRVAAISLPGCGGSQWRDRYSGDDFNEDTYACAQAAGLWDVGPPVYIGHSMGGAFLFHGATRNPERMKGLILVDTSFRQIPVQQLREAARARAPGFRRLQDTPAAAISRFRLLPSQPVTQPALADYIARMALEEVHSEDGTSGWAWRHDPDMMLKLEPGREQEPYLDGPIPVPLPILHIMGDRSHVHLNPITVSPLAPEVPRIVIPDCGHHIMVDRPLTLVAMLRGLLAVWPV